MTSGVPLLDRTGTPILDKNGVPIYIDGSYYNQYGKARLKIISTTSRLGKSKIIAKLFTTNKILLGKTNIKTKSTMSTKTLLGKAAIQIQVNYIFNLPVYKNNTEARNAGAKPNSLYRTSTGTVMIVY